MKPSFVAGLLAAAALAFAEDCEADYTSESTISAVAEAANTTTPVNVTDVFAPTLNPGVDTHNVAHVVPQINVSLYYSSNFTTASVIHVNNTMKYPTVLLEQIASVISVDCSADSVVVTFNDSAVFETTQSTWVADGDFVLITNHLGDCDVEAERGFYLIDSLTFDNTTLIVTASAAQTNISATAESTIIAFGIVPVSTATKRDLTLDPSYSLDTTIALPTDTTIYTYSPYLTVTADKASFQSTVTFSGYLAYNWLTFHIDQFYFDIDTEFSATLGVSAVIASSYNTTFSYSPTALYYGVSVTGIIELGPELKFGIDALVAASENVSVTAETTIALTDGNVHLDVLSSESTSTSGWNPTYAVSAGVSGEAKASINPSATLTVEIAASVFGGLFDLSTGLTAKPGFTNEFILTAAEGIDLTGVHNLTSNGTCGQGLELKTDFVFAVEAFASEWYSTELYSVDIPLVDECYSWLS